MKILRTVFPVVLLAAAACQSAPPKVYSSIEASTVLLQRRPIDVAVLPIEDATREQGAIPVLAEMREEIRRALVQRRYSPLATVKIDEVLANEIGRAGVSVVDASWLGGLGGRFGEDATMAVRLTMWDTTSLMATGRIRFAADVKLVATGVAEPLWGGVIQGDVKAGGDGPAPRDRADRLRSAAEQFAVELIRRLPRRQV